VIEPQRRGHLAERRRNAIPHTVRRVGAGLAEQSRDLPQFGDLGATARTLAKMVLDERCLVRIHGVQRVGPEQLLELFVSHGLSPSPMALASTSESRMRRRPERMRLFTVPSGSCSRSATSR